MWHSTNTTKLFMKYIVHGFINQSDSKLTLEQCYWNVAFVFLKSKFTNIILPQKWGKPGSLVGDSHQWYLHLHDSRMHNNSFTWLQSLQLSQPQSILGIFKYYGAIWSMFMGLLITTLNSSISMFSRTRHTNFWIPMHFKMKWNLIHL